VNPWLAVFAVPGIVIAALYLLRMLRGVLFGPLDKEENRVLTDLDLRETLSLVPILIFIVLIGVYPKPFLRPLEPVATRIEARMRAVRAQPVRFVQDTTGDVDSDDAVSREDKADGGAAGEAGMAPAAPDALDEGGVR
ncbi:MAG: hypothetical protein KAT18_08425, partial [Candidatus Latescibacteria bacterium]|nr:hypothetical protein [Candidatus Latescibacterota bacterium]